MHNHQLSIVSCQFLLISLLLISGSLNAQILKGTICDRDTREPVPNAHVYLEGSSLYDITNADGKFEIRVHAAVSASLVISHIAYATSTVSNPFTSLPDTVFLEEKTNLLGEVVVQVGRYTRKQLLKAFLDEFLGTSTAAKSCMIENADKIDLWFDSRTGTLSASCDEPVIVHNRYLGYRLYVKLDRFNAVYASGKLGSGTPLISFKTSVFFNDLALASFDKRIEARRQASFDGSRTNFLRMLTNHTIKNSDYHFFVINDLAVSRLYDCFTVTDSLGLKKIVANQQIKSQDQATFYGKHYWGKLSVARGILEDGGQSVKEIVVRGGDINKEQLRINEILRLFHTSHPQLSELIFFTDTFYIDAWGQLSQPDDLAFTGQMGALRFGDQLPVDYGVDVNTLQVFASAKAPEMFTMETLQNRMLRQFELFPQEKIHVHTDRTMYIPGEKIWFRVYVVDAFSHLSPAYSRYAYVELINSSDSLIHRVMVTLDENRLFHGHIFLSDFIPEGDYTLRAYTRFMENLGDDYFFQKNIRIGNLNRGKGNDVRSFGFAQDDRGNWGNGEIRGNGGKGNDVRSFGFAQDDRGNGGNGGNGEIRGNRTVSSLQTNLSSGGGEEDYDVSFYPEGGNFLEGVFSRVAFKALNRQGASESVTGMIVDREGKKIVDVETVYAGMGSFTFIPDPRQVYDLVCKSGNGQEKRFRLPPAQKTFSVSVNDRNNRHFIQVKKSPDMPEQPLYLLVHCKGEAHYFAPWDYQNEFISFAEDQLPAGIIQVVLFDMQMNPVSERLIFNKYEEAVRFVFSTDRQYYQKREKVAVEISLTDPDGITLAGNCSIAVTDNSDIAIDSLHTITSSLLLSSELRGYIETPGYYLQDHENATNALDHLMMTHGWRRYDIAEAVKGNYSRPETEYELSKKITGKVQTELLERPVVNGEVMFVSNEEDFGETVTDAAGQFRFAVHYADSTKFFIQAKTQRGGTGVEIVMYPEQFPKLRHAPVSRSLLPVKTEYKPSESAFDFLKKAEQRAQYDEDIRVVNLEELVVTANRINKRDEMRLKNPINALSSFTIYRDSSFYSQTARYVTDLFYGIAGVNVTPDGMIFIRPDIGKNNPLEKLPLVLIDGLRIAWPDPYRGILDSPLETVQINDVDAIDVFKGGAAAIFGAGSGNGVISITTKGSNNAAVRTASTNSTSFAPLGYQKPVEFYAPKYDTPELKNTGIPDYRTTIYWKPDFVIPDYGEASFEFYTSDFPTTYSVVIEGMSEDGMIIRNVQTIEVR